MSDLIQLFFPVAIVGAFVVGLMLGRLDRSERREEKRGR